jgi:pimeloyl-ACP methyl ester carboxylesterase
MGGLVVQKYLEKHFVPAAVLLASLPTGGLARSATRMAINHPWLFLKSTLTANMNTFISATDLVREAFFSEDMDEEALERYSSKLQPESFRAFLDMILLNLPRPDRITTPLLVLGAAKDRVITPKEVKQTARAYNAQSMIFDNMAHDMMLGIGWRNVADTIIEWLSGKNL